MKIKTNRDSIGYYLTLFGTVLLLIWIGIFKFTPTEANAIKPLIENHPLTFWVYKVFDIRTVSNFIGMVEILVASLILFTLKFESIKKYVGIGVICIFIITISYLFTTPNTWKIIDGIPVTDFFTLKDIAYLGFGITLFTSIKK